MGRIIQWIGIVCVLESCMGVLRRVLTTADTSDKYKATLISALHIALSILVLLTHCLHSIFAHKSANPFYSVPHPLSPPYMVACSFCLGY